MLIGDVASTAVAPVAGVVEVTVGGVPVVQLKTELDARLVAGAALICDATAVTVQVVDPGRLAVGVSVKVVALPGGAGARVNVSGVPVGHCSVNAEAVTFTALLKVS